MENIQVIVRVRPSNPTEREGNDLEIWQTVGDTITISTDRYNDLVRMRKFLPSQRVEFSFNQCYDQRLATQQIYQQQIKRIALSALQGINGTVFMYGQTGSGKTFTMMGPHGVDQPQHLRNGSSVASNTPKNLLKEFPNPPRPQTAMQRTNPRNNTHRSPSHKTKDRTPQRQESGGTVIINHDADTPDKLSLLVKKNTSIPKDEYRQLQFESEYEPRNQEGILILALQDLFSEIEKQPDKQFLIRCSYVEIYTDQVYDLLKPQDRLNDILSINEDLQREFYIKGATEEIVQSIDEILDMIRKGETNRHYASTIMNHASSRSHTIFRLYVRCVPNELDQNTFITESILNFVDLAGSEKINIHDSIMKKRGSSVSNGVGSLGQSSVQANFKERTTESKHINKSLFYLTQVISLRSQGQKDQHIPYRNSPLTKILRSSLGGNSRTAIILCVNPCFSQFEQTLSTLRFGSNAKQIRNNVQKNIVNCDNEEAIRKIIGDYERKISEMEKLHLNKNENLLKVIEILQSKAMFCNRNEKQHLTGAAQHIQQIIDAGDKPRVRSHIHFPGVGILQVGTSDGLSMTSRSMDRSFQENVCKREQNLTGQIRLFQNKIGILEQTVEEMIANKQEVSALFQRKMINQMSKLERKYSRQKKKLESQTLINQSQSLEIKRLQKICALYHSQLGTGDMILLDQATIEQVQANMSQLNENLLKFKLYRELSTKHSEHFGVWQQSESLKLAQSSLNVIRYPKIFLECLESHDHLQYWDTLEEVKPVPSEDQSFAVSSMQYTTRPVEGGFESFQNYFQYSSTGHPRSARGAESELYSINHQLTMLQSDYNILRISPVKKNAEYLPIQNEVQMSNQSIQNFKEPAIHHQKVQSAQLYSTNSPQIKERHRSQLEELNQMQQQLGREKFGSFQGGKENSGLTHLDFSKKTLSVPFVENEHNFSSYFDQRKQGKQY